MTIEATQEDTETEKWKNRENIFHENLLKHMFRNYKGSLKENKNKIVLFSQITANPQYIEDIPLANLPPQPCKDLIDFNEKFDSALRRLKTKKIENEKRYHHFRKEVDCHTKDKKCLQKLKKKVNVAKNKNHTTKA